MKRTVFPTALFAVAITALLAGAVASLSSTAAFVYAIDSDGKKIEAYFDPASFVIVKQDGEDD